MKGAMVKREWQTRGRAPEGPLARHGAGSARHLCQATAGGRAGASMRDASGRGEAERWGRRVEGPTRRGGKSEGREDRRTNKKGSKRPCPKEERNPARSQSQKGVGRPRRDGRAGGRGRRGGSLQGEKFIGFSGLYGAITRAHAHAPNRHSLKRRHALEHAGTLRSGPHAGPASFPRT